MSANFKFDDHNESIICQGYDAPSLEEIVFQHIGETILNYDRMASVFADNFKLNENQKKFQHLLDTCELPEEQQLYVLVYGDIGSGKTWLALQHILDKMVTYPLVRTIAVRRTAGDLEQSIYRETLEFFEKYNVPYKKNDKHLLITLPNRSYIHMRSDGALVQKGRVKSDALGSQQFSFAILEEADSVSEEVFNTLPARLRQKTTGFRKIIFLICNPPDKNHWLYRRFFKDNNGDDPRSAYRTLYCTQAGNAENLPEGYQESVESFYANSPGLHGAFLGGQWNPQVKGDPIFMESFNRSVHVAKGSLAYNPSYPVARMWDFGFRGNACHWGQMDFDRRQIRILKSHFGEKMTLDPFADEIILRSNTMFPVGTEFQDFGDPAGRQQTAHGLSLFDILKKKGITIQFLIHSVQYGIEVMQDIFKQMSIRQGKQMFEDSVKPFIIFDPSCEHLINALALGYCNKKDTPKGKFEPIKDGYYDHPVDALRYWLVYLMRRLSKMEYTRTAPTRYANGDVIETDGGRVHVVPGRRQRPTHAYSGTSFFGRGRR